MGYCYLEPNWKLTTGFDCLTTWGSKNKIVTEKNV